MKVKSLAGQCKVNNTFPDCLHVCVCKYNADTSKYYDGQSN